MPRSDLSRLLWAAFAWALLPAGAAGQNRDVVSQEINVGRERATLRLEFVEGEPLSVALEDGSIELNDETLGRYDRGGALDAAWRSLLGDAVSLSGGALARRLRDWSPPSDVAASERGAAERLDQAIEAALRATPTSPSSPDASAATGAAELDRAMTALVGRPRRLLELGRAVEDLDLAQVRVHVGEDVTVADGESVSGSVIVVDGDLELNGEIDGSVVMVGGALRLEEGGRITGDVRLSDARIVRDGGEVEGDVTNVRVDRDEADRERIRDEVRRELREETRHGSGHGPFGRAFTAVGELLGSLLAILVIGVLCGGLAVYFGRERMEVIGEAARQAPLRAGMVGLAGVFFTVPAWVLGALGLVVTIVGILALPFWVVLFPAAVCAALALGYLAIAQSVGEWVARQRLPKLEWVRISNPYSTVIAGVAALAMWFVASDAIRVVGFLGFVSVLLKVIGVLVSVAAALVGLGAVLLTRAGGRPAYAGGASYWEGAWNDVSGDDGGSAAATEPPAAADPPVGLDP